MQELNNMINNLHKNMKEQFPLMIPTLFSQTCDCLMDYKNIPPFSSTGVTKSIKDNHRIIFSFKKEENRYYCPKCGKELIKNSEVNLKIKSDS